MQLPEPPSDNATESPAALAIRLLSAKKIAAACDLTTNAVWKWRDGGLIPARHQAAVLALARTMGVAIEPADLIPRA